MSPNRKIPNFHPSPNFHRTSQNCSRHQAVLGGPRHLLGRLHVVLHGPTGLQRRRVFTGPLRSLEPANSGHYSIGGLCVLATWCWLFVCLAMLGIKDSLRAILLVLPIQQSRGQLVPSLAWCGWTMWDCLDHFTIFYLKKTMTMILAGAEGEAKEPGLIAYSRLNREPSRATGSSLTSC